jgi:hypothetical protein
VLPFIVVRKLTALDPLFTVPIIEIPPTAMTVRTTARVGKELMALIELILNVASLLGKLAAEHARVCHPVRYQND